MKHIKNFNLFEMAMGVPEGNVEIANLAYQRILDITDDEISELLTEEPVRLTIPGQFKINDFKFNLISIDITVGESEILYDKGKGVELAGMSFKDNPEVEKKDNKFFFISSSKGVVRLGISILVPFLDIEPNAIREYFEDKKVKMIASLSHEFKHAYDIFKNPITKASDRTEYSAFNRMAFGIRPIDDFFYHLYFTTTIENLVRPSELAGAIRAGEIDKEQFLDFLKDNRTYKELNIIKSYSYDKMRSELLDDVDIIRKRLRDSDIDVPDSDEVVVDMILDLTYTNLKHEKIGALHHFLMKYEPVDIFKMMMGEEISFEYLDEYVEKITYKNYKDFFENEIKRFIFVSNSLLKKLSKLYDMAKDVNVNPLQAKITAKGQKNESILDWELWQEMNGIKPNIKNIK